MEEVGKPAQALGAPFRSDIADIQEAKFDCSMLDTKHVFVLNIPGLVQ
jgi:hypothetical protein